VFGHAMDPNAISVGAAPYYSPTLAETFSSAGPGELLFDSNGNRLPAPVEGAKLDVTAPDGDHTSIYNSFFGTSATAPAAAAVGALMLQANPALDPSDIANLLEDSATAMADTNVTGAGLINASGAVAMAKTLTIAEIASRNNVEGTHLNDLFLGGPWSHTVDGKGGFNTLDYSAAPGPVVINLGSGSASNGYGGTDFFANIQNFRETPFNDIISAAPGTHYVSGGGGHDWLQLHGSSAGYVVTAADGQVSVADSVTNRDGTTIASGIEFLQFADKTLLVEQPGTSDVAALYSAALDRAPDIPGLVGWENIYAQALPASAKGNAFSALAETVPTGRFGSIAEGFTDSVEFQQKYGSLSDTAFVTQLYRNILDRAPEPTGLNDWLDLMHQGDSHGLLYTRDMVLVGLAASPENYAKIGADWLLVV
jgi:hypothetical protein